MGKADSKPKTNAEEKETGNAEDQWQPRGCSNHFQEDLLWGVEAPATFWNTTVFRLRPRFLRAAPSRWWTRWVLVLAHSCGMGLLY